PRSEICLLSLHDALPILRLLYTCNPRAFVTSSIASLFEPLFYPALLLLLHQLLQEVIGSGSTVHFTPKVALVGLGLVILILVQRDRKSTRLNSSHEWISY